MRNRFVLLALCLMLLAGVAAAAKFPPAPRKFSDGLLGRPSLIVRGHGLDAPVQEPLPAKQAEGIRVLIVNADDGIGTMAAPLMAYPDIAAVDWHYAGGALPGGTIPTVDFLLTYDVVIAWSNHAYLDRVAMGDTLADYVDAGGRLIMCCSSWNLPGNPWGIEGRILSPGYSPYQGGISNGLFFPITLGVYQAGHPIMDGVSNLSEMLREEVTFVSGAELVASWADGFPAVAVNGCIVGMNMFIGGDGDKVAGDAPTLFHNAILYLMANCGAPRDFIFVDDLGRSKLCINADGTFLFRVLTGPDAGEYEGTAQVVERAGVYVFMNPRGTPWTLYVVYDSLHGRAVGFYQQPGFDNRSHLSDRNTADNPDTCF